MLKVITVCGLGVGSSLIMKMTVESALKNLNIDAEVEHWDMGTVRGKERDFIVTTSEFEDNFREDKNIVYINNIIDVNETQEKIKQYLENKE